MPRQACWEGPPTRSRERAAVSWGLPPILPYLLWGFLSCPPPKAQPSRWGSPQPSTPRTYVCSQASPSHQQPKDTTETLWRTRAQAWTIGRGHRGQGLSEEHLLPPELSPVPSRGLCLLWGSSHGDPVKEPQDLDWPKVHHPKPCVCRPPVMSGFHFNLSDPDRQPQTHYAD